MNVSKVLTLWALSSPAFASDEIPVVNDGITGETIFHSEVTVETDRIHSDDPDEAARVTYKAEGYLTRTVFLKKQDDGTIRFRPMTLYRGSPRDSDRDGVPDVQEKALGTNPYDPDTDNDRLPDGTEINGFNYVDYPGMGANPRRPTIFVEVDYMRGLRPYQRAFDIVRAAFGRQRIDLIVDVDDEVPFDANLHPVQPQFQSYKRRYFSLRRTHGFHYALFASRYSGGTSSRKSMGIVSSDFLVTLGSRGGTVEGQAGTFMHELGHNLGLRHGGGDNLHRKPNYLSIMNYSFQFRGVPHSRGNRFDYSHARLPTLNERSLNEFKGIGCEKGYGTIIRSSNGNSRFIRDAASRIDWNGSGRYVTNLAKSINGDQSWDYLRGFDDWESLNFQGGGSISPEIGEGAGVALRRAPPVQLPGDEEDCLADIDE